MDWIELAILFVAMYVFLRFLRRTIAGGVFRGPAMLIWIVVLGLFWWIQSSQMDVLNSLFRSAFPIFVIALAMFCRRTVLPARGGETIRQRWPLPIGHSRSMIRVEKFFASNSRLSLLSG